MRYVISTAEVAPSERFDFWRDLLTQQDFDSPEMNTVAALPAVQARTRVTHSFDAALHATEMRSLSLVVTESDPMEVARTRAMVQRGDTDVYFLATNYLSGQQLQLGRDVIQLQPSDMILLHTSMPMNSRSDPAVHRQQTAMVLVNPDTVPGGVRSLRQLLGRRMSAADGMVSLVAQHLLALGTGHFRPGDDDHLSTLTSALLSVLLSRQVDAEHGLPREIRDHCVFARIRTYVLNRLGDPRLSPDTIAAAHHISTRTLHRLCQANGVAIAAWIRQLRLDRCRAELLDPVFAREPIHHIAQRWGFTEASQFSRAYRAAHRESPTATRGQLRVAGHGDDAARAMSADPRPSPAAIPDRRSS